LLDKSFEKARPLAPGAGYRSLARRTSSMFQPTLILFVLGALGALGTPAHDIDPLRDELSRLVGESLGDPSPGLALTVIHDGQVVWFQGFGVADRKTRQPITEDTVFGIASISKTVAAWGFLWLVEGGEVTLDEPVLQRIAGWKPRRLREESDGVTLRRLLSHTAGVSLHGVDGVPHGKPIPELLDAILGKSRGFRRVDMAQSPGEGFLYSGGGTRLAQLLFEQLTERNFVTAMQADVVLPLGMTASSTGTISA